MEHILNGIYIVHINGKFTVMKYMHNYPPRNLKIISITRKIKPSKLRTHNATRRPCVQLGLLSTTAPMAIGPAESLCTPVAATVLAPIIGFLSNNWTSVSSLVLLVLGVALKVVLSGNSVEVATGSGKSRELFYMCLTLQTSSVIKLAFIAS